MQRWKISFLVDNMRSEQIVPAVTSGIAMDLVKKQYTGHRVVITNVASYNRLTSSLGKIAPTRENIIRVGAFFIFKGLFLHIPIRPHAGHIYSSVLRHLPYGVENIVVVARAHARADHAEHGHEYKLRENHADNIGDDAEN